jgi:hypothetical protein
MPQFDNQVQTRLAMAALTAALVAALGERDESLASSFEKNIDFLYRKMRGTEGEPTEAINVLRWVREFSSELKNRPAVVLASTFALSFF